MYLEGLANFKYLKLFVACSPKKIDKIISFRLYT